jgi:hypothetical protein
MGDAAATGAGHHHPDPARRTPRAPHPATVLGIDRDLILVAEAGVTEAVTIAGVAPTIDSAPGASTTFIASADIKPVRRRHEPGARERPGVGFISEGQGPCPPSGASRAAAL